jgi:hypothetical protein
MLRILATRTIVCLSLVTSLVTALQLASAQGIEPYPNAITNKLIKPFISSYT